MMGEIERWEFEKGLKHWLQLEADKLQSASPGQIAIENLLDEITDCSNLGEFPWETIKREKGIV